MSGSPESRRINYSADATGSAGRAVCQVVRTHVTADGRLEYGIVIVNDTSNDVRASAFVPETLSLRQRTIMESIIDPYCNVSSTVQVDLGRYAVPPEVHIEVFGEDLQFGLVLPRIRLSLDVALGTPAFSPGTTDAQPNAAPGPTLSREAPVAASPDGAPVSTVSDRAPLYTVPDRAPVSAAPEGASASVSPDGAPLTLVPDGRPATSAPDEVATSTLAGPAVHIYSESRSAQTAPDERAQVAAADERSSELSAAPTQVLQQSQRPTAQALRHDSAPGVPPTSRYDSGPSAPSVSLSNPERPSGNSEFPQDRLSGMPDASGTPKAGGASDLGGAPAQSAAPETGDESSASGAPDLGAAPDTGRLSNAGGHAPPELLDAGHGTPLDAPERSDIAQAEPQPATSIVAWAPNTTNVTGTDAPVPASNARPEAPEVESEPLTQSAHSVPPPRATQKSRAGRRSMRPGIVPLLVGAVLLTVGGFTVLRPQAGEITIPQDAQAATNIPIAYRVAGLGDARYTVVGPDAQAVSQGPLPTGSGTFSIKLPAEPAERAYLVRVIINGALGTAQSEEYVKIPAVAPPSPAPTASPRVQARLPAADAPPEIRSLAVDRATLGGGQTLNIYYAVGASSGTVALLDAGLQVAYGRSNLAPSGHTAFVVPIVQVERSFSVVVTARRGTHTTESRVAVTVVPPTAAGAATKLPDVDVLPTAQKLSFPPPTISAPKVIRSGQAFRVAIRGAHAGILLLLSDNAGSQLARHALDATENSVVFTAQTVHAPTRVRLQATYPQGSGSETVIQSLTVVPR